MSSPELQSPSTSRFLAELLMVGFAACWYQIAIHKDEQRQKGSNIETVVHSEIKAVARQVVAENGQVFQVGNTQLVCKAEDKSVVGSRRSIKTILSRVLTILYPGHISSSVDNGKCESVTQQQAVIETHSGDAQPSAPSSAGFNLTSKDIGQNNCNRLLDSELNLESSTIPVHNEKELMHHQKIYTVSLPPDDYVPHPQNDEGSSSTEDSDLHEDIEDQPMKRRKRRKRRKKENITSCSSPDRIFNQQPTDHQPLESEGVFINKNKRRKLQRKRQKERLKAAGLWPKKKAGSDQMVDTDTPEQSSAQSEEALKKTQDLLDFLQATQEMYFTESKSPCADSALSIELVLEIMNQIKNGAVPFSELCLLHHLKSLLLVQDIERLKDSLGSFKEHSSMPLDPDGRENSFQWNGRTNRASSFFIRCFWNLDLQLQYTTDD
ncbi:PREDICTED: glutamate-rich protein 1 [Nanorana parkeri]|uniref:glutamate-rich protein 1 n=1 Tax=Nanorana parkeri TaxID=125878 RepID=UPI0008548787|nr:PREDICTED: glutamate-rich protein 1 [Nanorana parkeri]